MSRDYLLLSAGETIVLQKRKRKERKQHKTFQVSQKQSYKNETISNKKRKDREWVIDSIRYVATQDHR